MFFFSLIFQWLQHDICQFWWHQRFLETESGTEILQKLKQRRQCFNWNSYQPWSNTRYKNNNWLGIIFFSPGDSHTKWFLVLLHLGLEGVTEVDNDPKRRFVSFKVIPSNDRVLRVYVPLGHSIKEKLTRGCLSEGLQNYKANKKEGNEKHKQEFSWTTKTFLFY